MMRHVPAIALALLCGRSGAGLRPVEALVMAGPEDRSAAPGIDIARMHFVAGQGQPPHEVAIWGGADEAAAAQAALLWPQSAGGTVMGEAVPSHVDAGEAGCAALISVAGEGETNDPYGRAIGAILQLDLPPIRIGME